MLLELHFKYRKATVCYYTFHCPGEVPGCQLFRTVGQKYSTKMQTRSPQFGSTNVTLQHQVRGSKFLHPEPIHVTNGHDCILSSGTELGT